MHQRRPARISGPLTRMAGGLVVATTAAVIGVVITAVTCFPLCYLYTPDNPEWYLFACMFC